MFGKGKSKMNATGRFIMAAGRAVKNIAPPPSAANRKGNGTAPKTAPVKADAPKKKLSLPKNPKPSPGKTSPVRIA